MIGGMAVVCGEGVVGVEDMADDECKAGGEGVVGRGGVRVL